MTPKYKPAEESPIDMKQAILSEIRESLDKTVIEIERSDGHHRIDYISHMGRMIMLADRMGSPLSDFKQKYESFRDAYTPLVSKVAEYH